VEKRGWQPSSQDLHGRIIGGVVRNKRSAAHDLHRTRRIVPMSFTPGPAGGQQPGSFAAAPFGPDFDVANLLPLAASERLPQLRQRAKDAHALKMSGQQVWPAGLLGSYKAQNLTRARALLNLLGSSRALG
jgi:hypothetical protein